MRHPQLDGLQIFLQGGVYIRGVRPVDFAVLSIKKLFSDFEIRSFATQRFLMIVSGRGEAVAAKAGLRDDINKMRPSIRTHLSDFQLLEFHKRDSQEVYQLLRGPSISRMSCQITERVRTFLQSSSIISNIEIKEL
jgi:hypothetical protein